MQPSTETGPARTDLAERARLTTGAVTGVLNHLEKAGCIRRQADKADRRRMQVVMENARERILRVYRPLYERPSVLIADYGPDEIAVLADWSSPVVRPAGDDFSAFAQRPDAVVGRRDVTDAATV